MTAVPAVLSNKKLSDLKRVSKENSEWEPENQKTAPEERNINSRSQNGNRMQKAGYAKTVPDKAAQAGWRLPGAEPENMGPMGPMGLMGPMESVVSR